MRHSGIHCKPVSKTMTPLTRIAVKVSGVIPAKFRRCHKQHTVYNDLTPAGIISSLGLRDVNYNNTATLGHFWHQWMPWEE